MPILATDLEFYQSAQINSTGGAITSNAIPDSVLNNIFSDVTAQQASDGLIDYRKLFVKNNHASLTLNSASFWRSIDTSSTDDEVYIGLGTPTDADGSNELIPPSAAVHISLASDGADTRNVTVIGEVLGVRTVETVALNSTTEVFTSNTFDSGRVYLVYPATSDASRTITIRQGVGGVILGTIGINKLSAICYFNQSTNGLLLGNMAALGSQALWLKRVVAAGGAFYENNLGQIVVRGSN